MFDTIPFEIQVDIITRLPVKSLIQFRSVSKAWKSFIDSPSFIGHHVRHRIHVPHLLVSYVDDAVDYKLKCFSFVDDDHTFPLQPVSVPVPRFLNSLTNCIKISSSHGLLCFFGTDPFTRRDTVVLWNLTIRKSVVVAVPKVIRRRLKSLGTCIGFGVCPQTLDPKIVRITYIYDPLEIHSVACIPRQVEVFTISTGAWRRPYSTNLPRKSIEFRNKALDVDGAIYWLAKDRRIVEDGEFRSYYSMLISFDMTTEEFNEVYFPDVLACVPHYELSLSKIRESLVVIQECYCETNIVWMMEDGVPKSFIKIFTVATPEHESLMGFRNNSAPIVEVGRSLDVLIVVYEPYSKHIDEFCIHEIGLSCFVVPYMETLLLLDQPDFMVYNDIRRLRTKNKRL